MTRKLIYALGISDPGVTHAGELLVSVSGDQLRELDMPVPLSLTMPRLIR